MKTVKGMVMSILVGFPLNGLWPGFLLARQDVEPAVAPPARARHSVTVLVIDPEGNPVEGVTVEPTGMIFKHDPSFSISWIDDQPELVKNLVTDGKGEVVLTWPRHPYAGVEVGHMFLKVYHPSFVEGQGKHSVDESPFKVVLKRGFQAAVSVVEAESGAPIRTDLYATTNFSLQKDWTIKRDGTLVSPVFGAEETSFRLIQIVDGQAARFSDLIHVDPVQRSKFIFRDVKMHESVSIRGKLDEKVPRPVKDGWVVAAAVSIWEPDRIRFHIAWNWKVYGQVAEDGTFKLDGFPPDTPLQIFAICDGWANEPLTDEEFNSNFPSQKGNRLMFAVPQLVPEGQELTDLVVTMQPASRCTVKVVDERNNPIRGVTVSAHSNFVFFHGEGVASGFRPERSSVTRLLRLRRLPAVLDKQTGQPTDTPDNPHEITTDEHGLATIANLCGQTAMGSVYHPEYRSVNGDLHERFQAALISGKESEATVQLQMPKTHEQKQSVDDGDETKAK